MKLISRNIYNNNVFNKYEYAYISINFFTDFLDPNNPYHKMIDLITSRNVLKTGHYGNLFNCKLYCTKYLSEYLLFSDELIDRDLIPIFQQKHKSLLSVAKKDSCFYISSPDIKDIKKLSILL